MIATNTSKKTRHSYLPIFIAVFLLFITITTIAKEVQHIGSVNKDLCISCGICWQIDPMDITQDYDGTARVNNPILDDQKFEDGKNNNEKPIQPDRK